MTDKSNLSVGARLLLLAAKNPVKFSLTQLPAG